MTPVRSFGDRRPLLFVVILFASWIVLAGLAAALAGAVLDLPVADPLVQTVGTVTATLLLLWGVIRLGWIDRIGITRLGSWPSWIATAVLLIYVILVGFYAFFGESSFRVTSLVEREAWPILLQALRAAFVEEVVFRGVILYALLRAWGKSLRGVLAALLVQAVLFAVPHALQVLAGVTSASAVSNVLATLVFGLWTGMLVIAVGSIWPAVLLHAASNAFTLIKGLSSPWITPDHLGYLRGASVELPLILIGVWVLVKLNGTRSPGSGVET